MAAGQADLGPMVSDRLPMVLRGVLPVAYGVVWCLSAMRLAVPCLALRIRLLLRR
jgi:hypothetical protein